MLTVEATASTPSSRRRKTEEGSIPIGLSVSNNYKRGQVHWEPPASATKTPYLPKKPESDSTHSPNGSSGMPIDVDLSSYEPPTMAGKAKKPKIQVMIPKNRRPRPIFRKFSKESDGKSSGKKLYSPEKHSATSARELLPKSGALVPAKAAVQLGIVSKTPAMPAGMQLESFRTAPFKNETASQPAPTAPIGPSPVIGLGESGRSFTVPSVPKVPATSKSKGLLSDDRSLYEVPMPLQQYESPRPSRPSQETTDASVESEGGLSDPGRLSDYSTRTSMTSLDSKEVSEGKSKGLRHSSKMAVSSNSPPPKFGAFSSGNSHTKGSSESERNAHLNTRGVRLGEQMQVRAKSVPSPEKGRLDGSFTTEKPKRSLDEKRPILKRNEWNRQLEPPTRRANSIPSPEKNRAYNSSIATKGRSQEKEKPKQAERSSQKRGKQRAPSISKAKSLSNLNDKPLPPSPPPSAMAIMPDGHKSKEKNVFDESLELEMRRTQSQLSPLKNIAPPPRRSHSQRSQRVPTQRSQNSGYSRGSSHSRSRAGSRTRLDQLDRNFINASPKPDHSPDVAKTKSPTLSQAEFDLETHLTAITESPTYYFDHRFKTPEWEKSREQAYRYSSPPIPSVAARSPRRKNAVPGPLTRKRSSSAPPASPAQRYRPVKQAAIERQEVVSAEAAEQIIIKIMTNLVSLEDLFTTAIINKGFYRTFKRHELGLMKQVLHNSCPPAWEHRELTPPNPDEINCDDDLPVEEYSPTTYLECYGQDLKIIGGLKALILERCQSALRGSTAQALASTDLSVSKRIDAAFWRIWTFCVIFGAKKGREADIKGQMDWLRGGIIAHTQICTHNVTGTESMDLTSVLLAAPLAFAKGNRPGKGLTSQELYDMIELWTCLSALTQALHGRTFQAREFGIFDGTQVKGGDINGEEALLEDWLQYVMSLGLDAILGIASLAPESGPDAFELGEEQGWTTWKPPPTPEKGGTRSKFLKEAVGRVYEERISASHAATVSPIKEIHRKLSRDRVAGFSNELRNIKARPTYSRLPTSDERPMSEWQGASSELGFGPPVPPIQARPSPAHQQHTTVGAADSSRLPQRDRFGSVTTTGTNETHASPPSAPPGLGSPQPLPPTIFGHGGPFGHSSPSYSQLPSGLGITSPSGAPRINSTIPSSQLDLPLPPNAFGDPSAVPTPGAREVPAVLQLDLGRVEPVGTAERAVQQICEMGFSEEDAKRALRTTDIGDGLRVDRALELLLRE